MEEEEEEEEEKEEEGEEEEEKEEEEEEKKGASKPSPPLPPNKSTPFRSICRQKNVPLWRKKGGMKEGRGKEETGKKVRTKIQLWELNVQIYCNFENCTFTKILLQSRCFHLHFFLSSLVFFLPLNGKIRASAE